MSQCGNKFHGQRTSYVITAGDVAAGFATVSIKFDIPYSNNNYTACVDVEDTAGFPGLDFGMIDIHNKSGAGLDAIILAGAGTAGTLVIVHVIAFQD